MAGKLVRALKEIYFVSDSRREAVSSQVRIGSKPSPIYYALMGLSTLIAGFGLIADSPAIVIGAMLVSPLMTPIFGVALGMSTGDAGVLRTALASMAGGTVLALILGVLIGLLPIELTVTHEIMARTTPTILDLLVAMFAGLAGCVALLNEDVSPVLAGIAIATSLVPPLAASGICLALGAFSGATGAFLLFFANVMAIFFVASLTFMVAGFVPDRRKLKPIEVTKRFFVAGVCLLAVVVLLTDTLLDIAHRKAVANTVRLVLAEDVRNMTRGTLEDVELDFQKERVDVLARLVTNTVPSPQVVKSMQDELGRRLGVRVNLYMSCQKANLVSAEDASSMLVGRNLDGDFMFVEPRSREDKAKIAEQAMREWLGDRINAVIDDVTYEARPDGDVVYVTALVMRKLLPSQLKAMEKELRGRLRDEKVSLVMRCIAVDDFTIPGPTKAKHGKPNTRDILENRATELLSALPGIWVDAVAARPGNGGWTVGADTRGSRLPEPAEVLRVERSLEQAVKSPVKLLVWGQVGATVSGQGMENEEYFLRQWYQE